MSPRGPRTALVRWLGGGALFLVPTALSIAYLDRPSAAWAKGLDPALVAFSERFTLLGDSVWYLVPLALALPLLHLAGRRAPDARRAATLRGLFWAALFVFLAIALSGLLTDLLKVLFGRARPVMLVRAGDFGWHPLGLSAKLQSFPSGHANTVTALALALGFLAPRLLKPLLALTVLIALTRIAVGAHYPSDLLAGAAIAFLTTLPLRAAFARRGKLFRMTEDGAFVRRKLAD